MKNIHVLPTQNNKTKIASWIYEDSKITKVGELGLHINNTVGWTNCWSEKELYITNDKEVKDWYIYENKLLHTSTNHSKYEILYGKPIVFTTDEDLIKDGVQAIDDEFLEWFAKNPSCEEVETSLVETQYGNGIYEYAIYKKFIPKEEPLYDYGWCKGSIVLPKEELKCHGIISSCLKLVCDCELKQELPPLPYEYNPLINKKQETIEEDSFTLLEKELIKEAKKVWEESHPNPIEMALFGAEWQARQMYSEEEVHDIIESYQDNMENNPMCPNYDEWFKQFLKK